MRIETDNSTPVDGQIILVRISLERRPGEARLFSVIGGSLVPLFIACQVFVVLALFHRQWLYLPFLLVGTILWQGVSWYMKRMRKHGLPRELWQANINESDVAVVRRLGELTDLGAFGQPAPGKGRVGWLTEQGLYNGNGHRETWNRFNGFKVDIPQKGTHRILLLRAEPARLDESEAWQGRYLAGRVCLFAVPAVFIYLAGGLIGYHLSGMRLDVLADLLCSVLPLPLIIMCLALAYGRQTLGLSRNIVVVVNEKSVQLETVCELLQRHLPMVDREFEN